MLSATGEAAAPTADHSRTTCRVSTLCIRADANSRIGIGHVMRCVALGQAWLERGGRVCFVSALESVAMAERLHRDGFEHLPLPLGVDFPQGCEEDLRLTLEAVREIEASWLVLDGYQFDRQYMGRIQEAGLHLLLVDDVADRDLGGVEAVLNQNAYATEALYAHRTPRPELLLGVPHTLLRREFVEARGQAAIRREANRVLVTMGGADVPNATAKVMLALEQMRDRRLEVRLVAGGANPHLAELQALLPALRGRHEVELIVGADNMPDLMTWSDVTVTAAGSSCWELCCLGVPQLQVMTADNQRLMPGYFRLHDLADVFGELSEARSSELAARLEALLADFERRRRYAEKSAALIDGLGAARTVDFMLGKLEGRS